MFPDLKISSAIKLHTNQNSVSFKQFLDLRLFDM